MRGLIIAGTDTGVGKTVLSSLLMSALPDTHYWKPIQSGLLEETDSETVARLSECPANRILPEAYRLTNPLSPHLSARLDGLTIERAQLSLPSCNNFLIVETAGGVLVPLRDGLLQVEMMKQWGLPVLLAARSTLGTINHTLLTLEALRNRQIELLGVIAIGPVNVENEKAIEKFGNIRILGRIPMMEIIGREALRKIFEDEFAPLREVLPA